jgi:HEPN domain-containing protein
LGQTAMMTDDFDRHTPLGFFNFAASYRAAGDKLRVCKLRATHAEAPVTFLYYHSIELYLKAFLRIHGVSVKEIREVSHRFETLGRKVSELGLYLMDEDLEVIEIMATTDAWSRSRYLMIGPLRRPTVPALSRTCRSLDQSVGKAMQQAGVFLRRPTKARRVRG